MKTLWIILGIVVILVAGYFVYKNIYPSNNKGSDATVVTTSVTISNFAFDPTNISVSSGDIITFTNKDTVTHTITAYDGSFNQTVDAGQATEVKIIKAGTYDYHCSIHPSMKGSIVVK
jgi:plastocyanin